MEYWMPLMMMYSSIFVMLLSLRWGESFSFTFRVVSSFLIYTVCMACVTSISNISDDDKRFYSMLGICLGIGIFQGVVQSGIFGFTSLLPPVYNGACMTGQAVAGIAVCIIRVVTKIVFPESKEGTLDASEIFFYVAVGWCAICAFLFVFILRREFSKHYLRGYNIRKKKQLLQRQLSGQLSLVDNIFQSGSVVTIRRWMSKIGLADNPDGTDVLLSYDNLDHDDDFSEKAQCCTVMGKIWPYAIGAWFIMLVTFLSFPGLAVSIQSQDKYLNDQKWFGIILIAIFNVGDFTGRYLPAFVSCRATYVIHFFTVLRIISYPAFILLAPPYEYLHNDIIVYILMFFFAFSNGYCVTLYMMMGPDQVFEHEKEFAGQVMAFFMVLGIWSGLHIALVVSALFGVGHSS